LKCIHQEECPDLRFGQFVINVFDWISTTKQRRPFDLEAKVKDYIDLEKTLEYSENLERLLQRLREVAYETYLN